MKIRRKPLFALLLVLPLLLLGGFVLWAGTASAPMPEALAALRPDAVARVGEGGWLIFEPPETAATVGLVIYPGGRVDPRAYAPLARAVAEAGYLAVITPMPLNLAFLAPDRFTEVQEAYPEIGAWVLAGHSLGGAMAARFAAQNPAQVQGLALWAAYPAEGDDLSEADLAVVSVYGTLDGLATVAEVEAGRPLLPADTRWIALVGGNHAQFGWYGPQAGDMPATISREEQQAQLLEATLLLLGEVSGEVGG